MSESASTLPRHFSPPLPSPSDTVPPAPQNSYVAASSLVSPSSQLPQYSLNYLSSASSLLGSKSSTPTPLTANRPFFPPNPIRPSLVSESRASTSGSPSGRSSYYSNRSDGQDTFTKRIDIENIQAPVGSMSISPAHRDVVLASRKGLFIIDLNNPSRVPRFLPQNGLRSVADVQWAPHWSLPHSVISTSSHKMILWNLSLPSDRGVEREVDAHSRAITDINWAVYSLNIVATGGIDGWVKTWDLRTTMRRDASRFASWGWGSGATQVKWNRKNEHVIASAHDNKVLIWDQRMGSIPVTTISGHRSVIYGIDWSRENAYELLTCSLDKTIKLWNIDSLNPSSPDSATFSPSNLLLPTNSSSASFLPPLSTPARTLQTTSPVWRARFLPFGRGILSLPESNEHALSMWKLDENGGGTERIVQKFEGHTGKVKEFVWRIRGGGPDVDDRSFQLVTWGTDQSLRFWPIDKGTTRDVGHDPSKPSKVIMTRRGAIQQTFIEEPLSAPLDNSVPYSPIVPLATLTRPHSLTNGPNYSLTRQPTFFPKGAPTARLAEEEDEDTMGDEEIMVEVELPRSSLIMEKSTSGNPVAMTRGSMVRGPSKETRAVEAQLWNSNISYSTRGISRDGIRTPSLGRSEVRQQLQSETKEVLSEYEHRIKVEQFDLHSRNLLISLSGPWGPPDLASNPSSTLIRIGLSFPVTYPYSSSEPCTISTFDTPDLLDQASKARLRSEVETRCEREGNVLDVVIRFLLGWETEEEEQAGRGRSIESRRGRGGGLAVDEEEEESDSDEEDMEGSLLAPVRTSLTKENLRRPVGASFGPNGELCCFFSVASSNFPQRSIHHVSYSPATSAHSSVRNSSITSGRTTSALDSAMRMLSSQIRSDFGKRAAPTIREQYLPSSRSRSRQPSFNPRPAPAPVRYSSVLVMYDITSHFPPSKHLAESYQLSGRDIVKVCRKNGKIARAAGRIDHESAWTTIEGLLEVFVPVVRGSGGSEKEGGKEKNGMRVAGMSYWRPDWTGYPSGQQQVEGILIHFLEMGDVQLVATMACILKNAPTPQPPVMKPVDQPDFFSLRPPSYSQTLSGNRFTSIRDRPTRGRELDRDISPLHSPGLPRPPTTTPANTSSWSLLNTGFNILGGSYGSGSVGGGGGGGSASNPSGFNIGPGRVGRASSERRGSERRDSEVDLGSTLGTTKDASSLSRIDLRSPSLPGAATPPNSSDPIPVTRTQSLSEKERVKLQSSLAGQARPDGSVGGGGSLRSRVSFNAAAAAAGSSSSMMTGSGVGGLSGLGTAGTGSGAGSSLQKRMAAKDMALSLGGSQQQQQQQQQSQQTSRGKARLGIKATFVQPQLSKTEHYHQTSLLSPTFLLAIASSEHAYCDLLFRWDLLQRRAKLLNLVEPHAPEPPHDLTPPLTPPLYGKDDSKSVSSFPKSIEFLKDSPVPSIRSLQPSTPIVDPPSLVGTCVICFLPVETVSSICVSCQHVSHTQCFASFFSFSSIAATATSSGPHTRDSTTHFPYDPLHPHQRSSNRTRTCPAGCGCACASGGILQLSTQAGGKGRARPCVAGLEGGKCDVCVGAGMGEGSGMLGVEADWERELRIILQNGPAGGSERRWNQEPVGR